MPASMNQEQLTKIENILGENPLKRNKGTEVFNEVLQEIKDEESKKVKDDLKKKATELVSLIRQKQQVVNNFNAEEKKADKIINSLINQLGAVKSGNEPPTEQQEEEKKEEAAA